MALFVTWSLNAAVPSATNFSTSTPASVEQVQRRRPIRPVRTTPADWVRSNSITLTSTDLIEDDSDLAPLKGWFAGVRVIALGDGTHGTHEYYTVKSRLIRYLAREDGINIVAFEAPWAEFNALSEYLVTGAGTPRELLRIDGYFFWEYQEMLDLVSAARSYNETRGDKPALRFVGIDTLPFGSKADVIAFFEQVDPAVAPSIRTKYSCTSGDACLNSAKEVRQQLIDQKARYEAASSAKRMSDVLQSARVVEQWFETLLAPVGKADEYRDRFMAENLETVLDGAGAGSRAFFWGHNEHVGKNFYELSEDPLLNTSTRSAGWFLREHFGNQLYVLGSCFLSGSFTAYEQLRPPAGQRLTAKPMQEATAENYETFFRQAERPRLIINFRATSLPEWLTATKRLRHGQANFGKNSTGYNVPLRIVEKFDGVVYLELTTPAVPLP